MGNCLHVIQRGKGYAYVCRVPRDLLHLFPKKTIWKSLKAESAKDARLLAGAEEYRTQQLFMQLRTGMLPRDIEKRLIALYLRSGINALEAYATAQEFRGSERTEDLAGLTDVFDRAWKGHLEWFEMNDKARESAGQSPEEVQENRVNDTATYSEALQKILAGRDGFLQSHTVTEIANRLKRKYKIKLTPAEENAIALRLAVTEKRVLDAEKEVLSGNWDRLTRLKEAVARDLEAPYCDLKTVLDKYQENYLASKPHVTTGTKEDMLVECRVLLEVFGNISIDQFNNMDSATKLKQILRKYPKNKQQRFGDKSIHTIIRSAAGYETISSKTANEYIKRAKAVVTFANKSKMLSAANVYEGELFRTVVAAEDERLAYNSDDIARLIDAVCSQPLWGHNPAKPERFWIILIALFHGFRLGNIVKLTKRDIVQTEKGTWVFMLRSGKTKSTVRPVAICDALLLLGFLEWVEGMKREKLFQDSSASFSQWYNRHEPKRGVSGFEARYVTKDPRKCLYSLRHSFAGNVFDVTEDIKVTADLMGHSTGRSVTARYTKATKAETLKEITEKMQIDAIDLDRLEARAKELFGL